MNNERRCRCCGCTEDNACLDELTGSPCHWVEDDLCSQCRDNNANIDLIDDEDSLI